MTSKPMHLTLLFSLAVCFATTCLQAQQSITLQQAVDSALQSNHLLQIRRLQVDEQKSKLLEDKIKQYPAVTLNSTYQYNVNVGQLTIPQGSFGSLPLDPTSPIPLPAKDESFELGQHHVFNAGVTVYQPVTQQGKIKTGLAIDQTSVQLAETAQEQAARQLRQNVEKVYYGLLINEQQQREAQAKLELAQIQLYDVESALLAGKVVAAGKAGLQANVADQEQELLKLRIEEDDYRTTLAQLTGINTDSVVLQPIDRTVTTVPSLETYKAAAGNNADLQKATLTKQKSELGIKAAQQSYLPDLGVIAGYTYQQGNILYPTNSPFAGLNLKWNLQDVLANKQVLKQRQTLLAQADQQVANTTQQVNAAIEKAYRRLHQTYSLITVAQKAVQYREEALKVQQDQLAAGLNKKVDVLEATASLAKSQADLYAAQLSYQLALSDLRMLTGVQ